jgi:hypothetical protein
MLKVPSLSDFQSRSELLRDALVFAGGVIFFVFIGAIVLFGFDHRGHSIDRASSAVSMTIGAKSYPGQSLLDRTVHLPGACLIDCLRIAGSKSTAFVELVAAR